MMFRYLFCFRMTHLSTRTLRQSNLQATPKNLLHIDGNDYSRPVASRSVRSSAAIEAPLRR